jgi:hypothetical protein
MALKIAIAINRNAKENISAVKASKTFNKFFNCCELKSEQENLPRGSVLRFLHAGIYLKASCCKHGAFFMCAPDMSFHYRV